MRARLQRTGIASVCLLAVSVAMGLPAQADIYPTKPVRIINPAPAGNGPDVIGRIVAERLTQAWGQQVLVINRPGAGGLLAAQAAVSAERDGYTLYQPNASSMVVLPVTQKLSFDLVARLHAHRLGGSGAIRDRRRSVARREYVGRVDHAG